MQHLRPKSLYLDSTRQHGKVVRSLSSVNQAGEAGEDLEGILQGLVRGRTDNVPQLSSKVVRVFISSTFSDMVYERNLLMSSVYPELKHFCKSTYRLDFQMVDLRWGIREEAHDNHTIIDFCLKEIENCKNVSAGPNFVVLLGQKYGFRPFPPIIEAREFENIKEELVSMAEKTKDHSEVELLARWFTKDFNSIPYEYVLQPISSILPDISNHEDMTKQTLAKTSWNETRSKLLHVLRKGSELSYNKHKLSSANKDKYFVSVTEYEVERGLLNVVNADERCLCFVRTIRDLEIHINSSRCKPYLDLEAAQIDQEANKLLEELKEKKIVKVLKDERNYEFFDVEWNDTDNKDPAENEEYLKEFSIIFKDKMQWLIGKCAQKIQKINYLPRVVELVQHLRMSKARSESLRGREAVLKKIRCYATMKDDGEAPFKSLPDEAVPNRPLVLYGEYGSGKTSVSAKVVFEADNWFRDGSQPLIVYRFLGTTFLSCNVRLMLSSVCWQISLAYQLYQAQIPADFPGLVLFFHELLKFASKENPLILIFDGLDQLGSSHKAHGLAWLPFELPANVRLIVSTVPNTFNILNTLKTQMTDAKNSNFIEIRPLGCQLSLNLIKEWLQSCNKDLNTCQFDLVHNALSSCSLPLFTKLVFEEVRQWRSYFTPEQTVLQNTIEAIISSLFDRVENTHGQIFVKHTLSYLTASRNGLSDLELEDILSLDDEVLNDVFQHWLPPLRRIPPLLVPRLLLELSSYIIQKESNGTMVYSWFHAQFINVAKKRYLCDEQHLNYIHKVLAHYFLGTWSQGNKKPFTYSKKQIKFLKLEHTEGSEDRKVSPQPLVFGKILNGQNCEENFNLRKLSELPYHLLMSKMFVDLRQKVLLNYAWLYTKLTAMSLDEALHDYSLFIKLCQNSRDVSLLFNALRMSGRKINDNPKSLAFDLIGRLLNHFTNEITDVDDLALKSSQSELKNFLQQCDQKSLKHSSLLPLIPCFEPPKSAAIFVLEGHNQQVCDLLINDSSNELISVSKDGYLAFWDLSDGERNRIIDVSSVKPGRMTRLFQSRDCNYLVVDSDQTETPMVIINSMTGQSLYRLGSRKANIRRAFMNGNLFCRQKQIVDVESGREIGTIDDFCQSKTYLPCALTQNGRFIFISQNAITQMFDTHKKGLISSFEQSDNNVSILAVSSDDKLLFCGYEKSCILSVINIDLESESFGRSIFNKNLDEFSSRKPPMVLQGVNLVPELFEINICHSQPNHLLVNVSKTKLVNIGLEMKSVVEMKEVKKTFEESFLKTLPNTFNKSSFNYDGTLVLASSSNHLNIWKSATGEYIRKITIHSTVDFPYPWCISKSRNVIATGSTIDSAVRVWDLDAKENINIKAMKVYMNPVDCIACSPSNRLVYVKSYFALNSSSSGYKFFDRFGIDVWNVSTGTCSNLIPFSKYGRLIEMKCSFDGKYLALLLNTLSQWYISLLNLHKNQIVFTAHLEPHHTCKQFEFSPAWDFMVSHDFYEEQDKVNLWNVKKKDKIICFYEATSPLFTLDSTFLLYIDAGTNVILYNLKNMAPSKRFSFSSCKSLQTIPNNLHSILVTCSSQHGASVVLWSFKESGEAMFEINDLSENGFCDVSKNGWTAVDDQLRVWDLETGKVIMSFETEDAKEQKSFEKHLIKLTYDGKYCFWFDKVTCLLKVGRVSDGETVAQANVHEQLTTLESMDYGYVMFAGRKDGHVLIMKLLTCNVLEQNTYVPKDMDDRRNFLLDLECCSRNEVNNFDRLFQAPSQPLQDNEVNTDSKDIVFKLTKEAELPRLFTFLKASDTQPNINLSCSNLEKNYFSKSPNFSNKFSPMARNSSSLPRKRLNSKVEIHLVNSSNMSLTSQSSHSSQNSILDNKNTSKSQSENYLNFINGSLSKHSLDSLVNDDEKSEKKNKVTGSHSLKIKITKSKFKSFFSNKKT